MNAHIVCGMWGGDSQAPISTHLHSSVSLVVPSDRQVRLAPVLLLYRELSNWLSFNLLLFVHATMNTQTICACKQLIVAFTG